MRICDKTGWSMCRASTHTGSLVNLAWTADGTHLAGAGGNGTVCFGQLLERRLEWGQLEVVQTTSDQLETLDITSEAVEPLELRDRICNISMGFGYLVVVRHTHTRILVHSPRPDVVPESSIAPAARAAKYSTKGARPVVCMCMRMRARVCARVCLPRPPRLVAAGHADADLRLRAHGAGVEHAARDRPQGYAHAAAAVRALLCLRGLVRPAARALPPAHYRVILLFMPACVA